eukprot:Skav210643  [mRNA]  locus=scaffold3835:44653:45564:- [translate_table: standard]
MELRVCKFVTDHEKWAQVLSKRAFDHRDLTVGQQQRYSAFRANMTQKLVFNKKTKSFVADSESLRRNAKDCVCVTLHLSDDPQLLRVESGSGEVFQLLLLKKEDHRAEVFPDILNHAAKADDITNEPKHGGNLDPGLGGEEDREDTDGNGDLGLSEAQIQEMDHQRMQDQAGMVSDEDEEIEIMADTDDEVASFEIGTGVRAIKVKGYPERAAWVALGELTDLPRHVTGCSISYHRTSGQWQGFYPGSREPMSATWGPSSKRTETEAILKVVKGILISHVNAHPKDKVWAKQLQAVRDAEAKL